MNPVRESLLGSERTDRCGCFVPFCGAVLTRTVSISIDTELHNSIIFQHSSYERVEYS